MSFIEGIQISKVHTQVQIAGTSRIDKKAYHKRYQDCSCLDTESDEYYPENNIHDFENN
jgi:hypothetical protein